MLLLKNHYNRLILMAILILGLLLSVFALGAKSFWTDEIFSIVFANGDIANLLSRCAADLHPPLYFLVLHFWIKVVGESVFWLRFLSIIPFVISIYVLYRIGRELFDEKTALLGAFFCSISPVIILYSRMVRYYSLTAFLVLLSIYFFVKLLKKDVLLDWVFLSLSMVLLLYTDYPSYFYLGLSQFFALLFLSLARRAPALNFFKWAGSHLVVILLYIPWIMVLFRTTGGLIGHKSLVDASFGPVLYIIKILFPLYSFSFGETLFPWHLFLIIPGFIIFFAVLIAAVLKGWASHKESLIILFSFSFLTILHNAILLSVFATKHSFIYYPRTIISAAFIYLLLIAFGLMQFKRNFMIIAVLVIVLVNSFSIMNMYQQKEYFNPFYIIPWKEAAQFIKDNSKKDDLIISEDGTFKYYLDKVGLRDNFSSLALDEINRNKSRFWLVLTGRDSRSDRADYKKNIKTIKDRHNLLLEKEFVVLDPDYVKLRDKLFDRKTYRSKLLLYLFD